MTGLRLLFMGTPEFAAVSLRTLIDRGEQVIAAVTQPDRPKGRGQRLVAPPVKALAEECGIPVLQPVKVRAPEFIETVKALEPELVIVAAFGQILPKALLDIPRHGCINVHASLLPRYRGAAPINRCIMDGETETGVTIMQMDVGLDTGDMLLKRATVIAPDEDASRLHDRLAKIGAEALAEALDLMASGGLVPEKQDDRLASYAPMLRKEEGLIDWDREPEAIRNMVRGLNPWPGAYTFLDGRSLKIFRCRAAAGSGLPGTVLEADRSGFVVACRVGGLLIEELQLEGKKRLSAKDFLAGYNIKPGTVLVNRGLSSD
ncbi:MAG TPA: methionyl-tRNA formyltransferase [Geobacteraceae bacterium]|nr:methionyl-tRNA formyltransferase [Geobacteraceae bacterium]